MNKINGNFRSMNCGNCQCNICRNQCMLCCECYRAEYAQEEWQDLYYPYDKNSKDCHEF
jgi:hypothetical protein|nr:MAG TPA: hypothetical protein [Caudoviricetes sp.]